MVGKCSNTLIKKIPTGMYKRVRFDIDDYESYGNSVGCLPMQVTTTVDGPVTGNKFTCYCPGGSSITTMAGGLYKGFGGFQQIEICRWNCRSDYPYLTGGVCYSGCNKRSDDWPVGPCCWTHNYRYGAFGEYWGDWAYSDYCKSSYVPQSFYWGTPTSQGYICGTIYYNSEKNRVEQFIYSSNAPEWECATIAGTFGQDLDPNSIRREPTCKYPCCPSGAKCDDAPRVP